MITDTAYRIATLPEYQEKLGKTHVARIHSNREMWAYYDKVSSHGTRVRVQRAWLGEYTTNYWDPNRLIDLVPIEEVPENLLPENLR